jgi:hypothetical protein
MSKIAWLFDSDHWLHSVSLLCLLGSYMSMMMIAFVTLPTLVAVAIGGVFLTFIVFLGVVWFGHPAQPALSDRTLAASPKRDAGY